MSRARSGNRLSVSLFPFLAVLICAMGALIFLLIAITQEIRASAIAQAHNEQQKQMELAKVHQDETAVQNDKHQQQLLDQLNEALVQLKTQLSRPAPELAPLRAKIEKLKQLQSQLTAQSRQQTEKRNAVKAKIAELEGRLQAAKQNKSSIQTEQQKLVRQRKTLEQQLPVLAQQIEENKAALVALRKKLAAAESAFEIVPFDGKRGTTRRPIFIECAGDSVRFMPEEVSINKAELEAFDTGLNPIILGVRALKKYWARQEPAQPEPYVILILKPSGVKQYKYAHLSLLVARQQFGYELLAETSPLAYPASDPGARAVLEQTVRDLLDQRQHTRNYVLGQAPYRGVKLKPNPNLPPVGAETPVAALNTIQPIEFPKARQQASGSGPISFDNQRFANQRSAQNTEQGTPHEPGKENQTQERSFPKGSDFDTPLVAPFEPFRNESVQGPLADQEQHPNKPRTLAELLEEPVGVPALERLPETLSGRGASAMLADQPGEQMGGQRQPGQIGYERKITLESYLDSLVLDGVVKINIEDTATNEKITQTVKYQLRQRILGWGKPPAQFYWLPNVQLVSSPGGNVRALMLRNLIKKWGLTVEEDVVIETIPEADFLERKYEQAITIK